jgi:ABC-type nitrate/sulfonate/bicarbonate transport system substrate-binding protein
MKNLNWLGLVAAFLTFTGSHAFAHDAALTKIRVGWQVPWATQGQLVQIWKHTDILKKHGLEAEFIGKTYGPVLNEVALAGGLDVILTADQPAAMLFSKDKGWIGIGRLMYNRTSVYAPLNSPVKTLKDLKGKTLGLPVGAAAERVAVAALKRDGLEAGKDVKIVNLGILEQGPLILANKDKPTWGQFDALSGFDPSPAIFEARNLVRVLDVGTVCSLVLMNQEFIAKNKNVAENVMNALIDAYDYYRQHEAQANEWFLNEAKLKDADQKACTIAASVEPNLKVKTRSQIRVSLDESDFATLQSAADFLKPVLKRSLDMRKYVSNKYVHAIKK